MKHPIVLVCPVLFAVIGLVAAVVFARMGWDRRFARIVFWVAFVALLLYAGGVVISMIGDMTYDGSREQFAWSPVYWVTIPMVASGAMLAFTVCGAVVVEAVLYAIFAGQECGESESEDGIRE